MSTEETKIAVAAPAAESVPAVPAVVPEVAVAVPAAVEETVAEEKPVETAEPAVVAAATTTEEAPVESSEPVAAATAVEESPAVAEAEETPKEITPITTGFLNVRHFFIFDKRVYVTSGSSRPVSADKMKAIVKRDVSRSSVAWASVTGEGLLLCSENEEQNLIDQIIRLDNATIKASEKDKKKIVLKVDNNTKTYDLIAKDADDRDAWVKGLESIKAIADAKKAEVEASETYKKALEPASKAKAESVEPVAEKPAEKAVEPVVEEPVVSTEAVPEIKTEAKSPSEIKASHRTSILGNIFRRSTDQRQAEAKTEPVADPSPIVETPAEPVAEAVAEPEAAAVSTPVEEVKSDDEKTSKITRRHTAFLKNLFPKKEAKAEGTAAEAESAPAEASKPAEETPAVVAAVEPEEAKPVEEEAKDSKPAEETKEKTHGEGVVRRILGTIRSRVPSGGDPSAAPSEAKVEKSPDASPETKRFNRFSKYLNFNKVRVAEVTDAAQAKTGSDAVDSSEKPPKVDVEGLASDVPAVEPVVESAPIDSTKAVPVASTAA